MISNKEKGLAGENRATEFLKHQGYTILTRNYQSRFAEIDIIACKENILCFVEVKSRISVEFGLPCEAVDYRKQEKIRRLAELFIQKYQPQYEEVSFDIIEIYQNENRLNHIKNAF